MSATRPSSRVIELRELLAPRVQDIVTRGTVIKDPEYSLFHVAREAIGWQRWMQDHGLPVVGSPQAIVIQAARSLQFTSADVQRSLDKAAQETCIPSAKFKDRGSDVACWVKVVQLNEGLFQSQCPVDLQLEVLKRMAQGDSLTPGLTAQHQRLGLQQEHSLQGGNGEARLSTLQEQLNNQFALMGRQLVAEAGSEQEGQRTLKSCMGRAQYKVTLNLSDNTMRIYALGRGAEPILVDRDGKVDHPNARVSATDLKTFQSALDHLQKQRKLNVGTER